MSVVVNWPHRYLAPDAAAGRVDRRTVVTVLTHDPKFDVPRFRRFGRPWPPVRAE
jgi:xanthine/CO dehydrogenase XdhC/CoxF family maturation factor